MQSRVRSRRLGRALSGWRGLARDQRDARTSFLEAYRRIETLKMAGSLRVWALKVRSRTTWHRRMGALLARTQRRFMQAAFSRMSRPGLLRELGAPLSVVQQLERTFTRNLERGVEAKERVQDTAAAMLRRQYNRVTVARLFSRWAASVRPNSGGPAYLSSGRALYDMPREAMGLLHPSVTEVVDSEASAGLTPLPSSSTPILG